MLKRWLIYLNEVFLPLSRVLAASILVVGLNCLYQAMLGQAPLVLTWDIVPAVITCVLIILYWRVQDEFKDADTDRKFFPDRPVPSGRVSLRDLKFLMWTIFAVLFAINLVWQLVVVPFLVLFVYAVLMHKWFFLEKYISKNRLLAFATHGPIGIIANYFVLAAYANRFDVPLFTFSSLTAVMWFAFPGFAWEIARKTRALSEEIPGYQTYSAMIGSTNSALLSIAFTLGQCVLAFKLPVSSVYLGVLSTITVFYVAWFSRFALRPAMGSKTLRPVTEFYGLISMVGLIADLIVGRGIVWASP